MIPAHSQLWVTSSLVKGLLVRRTRFVLHLTTISYTPDSTDISSVSSSDYGLEDDELYNNCIYGKFGNDGSNNDNNDGAWWKASYGKNWRLRILFSLESLRFSEKRGTRDSHDTAFKET